jgi:hypothetical protein
MYGLFSRIYLDNDDDEEDDDTNEEEEEEEGSDGRTSNNLSVKIYLSIKIFEICFYLSS